jgi:hypothetical protein
VPPKEKPTTHAPLDEPDTAEDDQNQSEGVLGNACASMAGLILV